jgi:hypothetical protein
MNRSLLLTCAGVVVASCLSAAPARAGVTISIYPPAAYIATSRPVYYQGHATYWYHGRWHYRYGRNWRTYNTEPRYLRDYRGRREPERHYYGYRR